MAQPSKKNKPVEKGKAPRGSAHRAAKDLEAGKKERKRKLKGPMAEIRKQQGGGKKKKKKKGY